MKRLVTALSVLCLATVLPLSLSTAAADFPVAKQGTALCSIETGKNPDMIILLAARELQHWVREITGAALEIREEARKPKIVLAVNDTVPELRGNDGYAVRGGNGELRIIGSCPKGVLNGVFRTLYRDGGLIWARPEPEIGTGRRRPDSSGSESSIRMHSIPHTQPFSLPMMRTGLVSSWKSMPSSLAWWTSSLRAGNSSSERR